MFNHEPENYICPFCLIASSVENDDVGTRQSDVVLRGGQVTAFIGASWWPNNLGHVIIIPNQHFENIFDLPDMYSAAIHSVARKVAVALMSVYNCDGISSRQHNGPSGNQDVWHYHLHVFPRYKGDNLYKTSRRPTTPEERLPYASKLRAYFNCPMGKGA